MAAKFLLSIGRDFQAVITAEKYFGFLLTVILGLGLMFEMPILILLLSLLGVVTPRFLLRYLPARGGDHLHRRRHHHADPGRREPLHLRRARDLGLYFLGVAAAFLAARFAGRSEAELAAADGAE